MPTAPTGIFQKCLPAYRTSIKQCGSVTICNVGLPTSDDLAGIFYDSAGNPRINDALFVHDFELKTCQVKQNGMYDFLMANKVNMSRKLQMSELARGIWEIKPFVTGMRKGLINNNYWLVASGNSSGLPAGTDWQVTVTSATGIPADISFFQVAGRVHIVGQSSGGSKSVTAWSIVGDPVLSGSSIVLNLKSQNKQSAFSAAKLENPVTGWMVLGTPNVSDYEEFCKTVVGLNTNSLTNFWLETTRNTLCTSEQYERFHALLRENNPMYAQFGDIETVELNKQAGEDFQKRMANQMWYGKKLAGQSVATYTTQLDQINTPVSGLALDEEGRCVGRRANMVGIYEQLQECARVKDLQGQQLNLQEFFLALYEIWRFRDSMGMPSDQIDVFTDTFYARQFDNAMITYFKNKAGGNLYFVQNVDGQQKPKDGPFGFHYKSYDLDWPPVKLNIISHLFFDDQVAVAKQAGMESVGRTLAVIDFSQIYPGIVGTNRQVLTSGDLQLLAKVNPSYMCRMATNTLTKTHTSVTMAMIVECAQSSMIFENLSSQAPDASGVSGSLDYEG